MLRSLVSIFLLLITSLASASNHTTSTLLVVGDSISAAYGIEAHSGWVTLLATKITQEKKPYQVINASISGDTTISALNRLQPLLNKYQPKIVVLELGGNDGLRGLSLKSMETNLKKMIELCQRHNAKVLLAGMKIPPNYGKRYTEAFYKVYSDLSNKYNTALIPFLLDGIGEKRELMQNDGIHPTQEAQSIIMDTVWNQLKLML